MKVSELVNELGLTVWAGGEGLSKEISGGYTSDLLSDVMGHAQAGQVWLTLQTHKNVMAIASLKEMSAIVIVKGFKPEEGTISQANTEGIPILGTEMESFEITGIIYALIKPVNVIQS